MIRYVVTERKTEDRTLYGITALQDTQQLDHLDDVAATSEQTMQLAALLQKNGVAVEHFRDVIEDYIAN
jgi:hypothetical protein